MCEIPTLLQFQPTIWKVERQAWTDNKINIQQTFVSLSGQLVLSNGEVQNVTLWTPAIAASKTKGFYLAHYGIKALGAAIVITGLAALTFWGLGVALASTLGWVALGIAIFTIFVPSVANAIYEEKFAQQAVLRAKEAWIAHDYSAIFTPEQLVRGGPFMDDQRSDPRKFARVARIFSELYLNRLYSKTGAPPPALSAESSKILKALSESVEGRPYPEITL